MIVSRQLLVVSPRQIPFCCKARTRKRSFCKGLSDSDARLDPTFVLLIIFIALTLAKRGRSLEPTGTTYSLLTGAESQKQVKYK